MVLFGAFIGWMLWELYKLLPNIRVCVVLRAPEFIFLLNWRISSERAVSFYFN
jgi:hypothetical protein